MIEKDFVDYSETANFSQPVKHEEEMANQQTSQFQVIKEVAGFQDIDYEGLQKDEYEMIENPYLEDKIAPNKVADEEQKSPSKKKFNKAKLQKNLKGGVNWLKKHGNDLVIRTKDEISGKKQNHHEYQFDDQSIFYQMD